MSTTRPYICARPEEVDSNWINSVLNYAGYTCEVQNFQWEKIGTGQVGQNIRFKINYLSGYGPATLVGKFVSSDAVSRQTGIDRNTYIKEVRFYQQIKPGVDIQTPGVLFVDIDPLNHNFSLMMEDLFPASQGDQLNGCNFDQAKLALEQLAKLHGPRWGDKTLEQIDWLAGTGKHAPELGKAYWDTCWPEFAQRYATQLSPEQLALAQAYGKNFIFWAGSYTGPKTVCHGDYRLDNMMFEGQHPLTVVDWQTPSVGPGAADAAYFLGTSLPGNLRLEHERDLLSHYHAALSEYVMDKYSFQNCWRDYRRYSFTGLYMAVVASVSVGRTKRGDAMFLAMARRSAQMALELDASEFLMP